MQLIDIVVKYKRNKTNYFELPACDVKQAKIVNTKIVRPATAAKRRTSRCQLGVFDCMLYDYHPRIIALSLSISAVCRRVINADGLRASLHFHLSLLQLSNEPRYSYTQ